MSPLASSLRFLQTQSDARLIELARDGHERAFEALVHRYRRQLLAYCRRLMPTESSAEDILQQSLLQAWVAIGSDREVRDVRAWLHRIVHNVAISHLRRAGTELVELDRASGAGGADTEVERRFAAREALAWIAALPDLQRHVMLSTALEGRSHEEIAATLGISHGAVRGLIYRARVALRAAAAAVIPEPVIAWAARQDVRGTGRVYEAIAGGGSAGVGGLLLKSGAVVATAGALATAAGLGPILHQPRHRAAPRGLLAGRPAAPGARAGQVAFQAAASSASWSASHGAALVAGAHVSAGRSHGQQKFVGTFGSHGSASTEGRHAAAPPGGGGGDGGGRSSGTSGGDGGSGGGSGGTGGHDGGSSGSSTATAGTGGLTSGGDHGGSSGGGDGGSTLTTASTGSTGSDGGSTQTGSTNGTSSDGGSFTGTDGGAVSTTGSGGSIDG